MKKALLIIPLVAVCLPGTSPLNAQPVDLFEARVHGFNQGNRNLAIHVFNPRLPDWCARHITCPLELLPGPS